MNSQCPNMAQLLPNGSFATTSTRRTSQCLPWSVGSRGSCTHLSHAQPMSHSDPTASRQLPMVIPSPPPPPPKHPSTYHLNAGCRASCPMHSLGLAVTRLLPTRSPWWFPRQHHHNKTSQHMPFERRTQGELSHAQPTSRNGLTASHRLLMVPGPNSLPPSPPAQQGHPSALHGVSDPRRAVPCTAHVPLAPHTPNCLLSLLPSAACHPHQHKNVPALTIECRIQGELSHAQPMSGSAAAMTLRQARQQEAGCKRVRTA